MFLHIHGTTAAQPCTQSWKQIIVMYGKDYTCDVDVCGRTALHVLVTSVLSDLDLVSEMVVDVDELDPTSATNFDDSGLIPLHAALIHAALYPNIEQPLICNGISIFIEVGEGCDYGEFHGMLPF